jgi:hypothetical protein
MSEQMMTQIGDEVRPMTAEEQAAHAIAIQDAEKAKQASQEKEAERRAILAKLGLTEHEIDVILGA